MDDEKTTAIRLTREQEKFVLQLRRKDEFTKWSLTKIAHKVFDWGIEAAKHDAKMA
ncbi:hypothetical protein FACS18948_6400 [Clostridia bacterium]|nr:hypothetical protein AGMMS49992_16550 [Clostridia bacterium]GHV28026.1 hypothetical protein FACS18948_6400 [Clostridia bacterium]